MSKIDCVNCDAPTPPRPQQLEQFGAPGGPGTALSPQEAAVALNDILADLIALENAVGVWHMSLFRRASVGVVQCGELQDYNQFALATYGWERILLTNLWNAAKGTTAEKIFKVGLPTEPRDPVLFGYNLGVGSGGHVNIDLGCPREEYADMSRLKQFGQPSSFPCPPPEAGADQGKTFQGIYAVCTAGPWALLGCAVVATFTYAVIDVLSARLADMVAGADGINLKHARIRAEVYAKRASLVENCLEKFIQKSGGNASAADLLAANTRCVNDALAALPDPSAGLAATPVLKQVIILAAVVGVMSIGGLLAYRALKTSGRETTSVKEMDGARPRLKRVV